MSVKNALRILGFSDPESSVIEYMLDRTACSAEEIIRGTGMSRGTVYKALSNLTESGRISKSKTKPIMYSINRSFTFEMKEGFLNFYKNFMKRISEIGVAEGRSVAVEVYDSFGRNGFALRDVPSVDFPRQRIGFRFPQIFDKIADAEYSIAISILDKTKKWDEDLPDFLILDQIRTICRRLNCITAFILVHNDRKDFETLYNRLASFERRAQRRLRPEPYYEGIEDRGFYVFKTTTDLDSVITNSIREIRERYLLVRELVSKLRERTSANHELIHLSQEHVKTIEDFLVSARPFSHSKVVKKKIGEIGEPVQRIKNRESRNLQIVSRLFSEYEVRVNQYIDRFEGRTFLPSINSVNSDISQLEQFEQKFKPIEYELNYLRQGLFKYALNVMRRSVTEINPFLFTEPYEKTPFCANQEKIRNAASDLAVSILEERPSFFQILVGEAGIGKTHCLKYLYAPLMESKKIKTIYVDCPVSFDLFAGVFQELTQEVLYPEEAAPIIRNLRRVTPTLTTDFVRFLSEISEIFRKLGYRGVLIILDELENTLPTILRAQADVSYREIEQYSPPIALRQLRELLTSEALIPNMGFVISCRTPYLPMLDRAFKIENFNDFLNEPERLSAENFAEIVKHRYQMWDVHKPRFELGTIEEVVERTKGNARDTIKYCRALFEFAKRNKLDRIEKDDVKKIGPIPLFVF